MKTEIKVKTRVTYTFTLEEVLKALDLHYLRGDEHYISIGMDNDIPTVELVVESLSYAKK